MGVQHLAQLLVLRLNKRFVSPPRKGDNDDYHLILSPSCQTLCDSKHSCPNPGKDIIMPIL